MPTTSLLRSAVHAQACLSAGRSSEAVGAINASKGGATRRRVRCDIETGRFASIRPKLRLRYQGEPRDRVEGRFRFVPLDTRVLNPKVGVPAPTQLVILPTARNWQPKVELLILPFPLRCRISSSCRPFGLVLYRGRVALSGDGTVEFQAKDLNLLGTLAKIHRRYLKSRRRLILGILNRAHMVFTRSKTT